MTAIDDALANNARYAASFRKGHRASRLRRMDARPQVLPGDDARVTGDSIAGNIPTPLNALEFHLEPSVLKIGQLSSLDI